MSLMSEHEELLELLKPAIAMREEWFARMDHMPVVIGVEESAEKIDLLLGWTLAAYKYFIDKQLPESSLPYQWQKSPDDGWQPSNRKYSFDVDFYAGMHFWKMCELIPKLTLESSRTHFFIRSSLLREILYKQLELCRLMMNFSGEGDIWDRAFGAAIALMELLYKDENPAQGLTYIAEYECLPDRFQMEFSYPRFEFLLDEKEHLFNLAGIGIDIYLRSERFIPEMSDGGHLRAVIDDSLGKILTVTYDTSAGTFFRDRGYWWEFLDDAAEYFEDHSVIHVKPEFVQIFDEHEYAKIDEDEILPFVIPAEELFKDD